MLEELHQLIELLKLRGMASCLDTVVLEAQRDGLPIQDVLHQLLKAEHAHKVGSALRNRLKNAKMPWNWSLDTFPFKQQAAVSKPQIMSLAKLDFINHSENIIFIGNPGVGKTGLAISLLRLALTKGYRGRFYNAQELLDELYTSLADRSTSSLLKIIANYDILVVDELGYLSLTTEQINIFFKLIDMRYHKKSTIITTNLEYPQWYEVFKNKELVDAMLDRFKHYCNTIHINGKSLRAPEEQKESKALEEPREGRS
ncbi:TPA: AAA family ATPase [Legionella pneumophila subsp. pneumophila]|nr:AAA family ATPase [Legionella pneumophila subsp. pneumophila]HAT9259148.1 AAA family ATPase [Legionella pneumophila subsp. pneumophila]